MADEETRVGDETPEAFAQSPELSELGGEAEPEPEPQDPAREMLRKRRQEMWEKYQLGLPISRVIRELAEQYGVAESTLWKDYRKMDSWVHDVTDVGSSTARTFRTLGQYAHLNWARNTHIHNIKKRLQALQNEYDRLTAQIDALRESPQRDKDWKDKFYSCIAQRRDTGIMITNLERCAEAFYSGVSDSLRSEAQFAMDVGIIQKQPIQIDLQVREHIRAFALSIAKIIEVSVPDVEQRDALIQRILAFVGSRTESGTVEAALASSQDRSHQEGKV